MAPEPVDISAASTQLFELVARVERGEEIVIARGRLPVARLVPFRARTKPRVPGRWRGQIVIAPDFDDPNEAISRQFYGSTDYGKPGGHMAPRQEREKAFWGGPMPDFASNVERDRDEH